MYSKDDSTFRHLDSSRGLNAEPAKKLAVRMHKYLG